MQTTQLSQIRYITGTLVLQSGLHIGAGESEMRIGGTDKYVVKDPISGLPYIPGSSLKGKIRSLLEWRHGLVGASKGKPFSFKDLSRLDTPEARHVLKLFGGAPNADTADLAEEIGPTRLAFWDCHLTPEWIDQLSARNIQATEAKSENSIDRIRGVAENPRLIERVIAGSQFHFKLTLKVIDGEDALPMVLQGLKLLEVDSLGGSGSRGYGKVVFKNLQIDGISVQADFDQLAAFA